MPRAKKPEGPMDDLSVRCRAYLQKGPPKHMKDYVHGSITEIIIATGGQGEVVDGELGELAELALSESANFDSREDAAIREYLKEGSQLVRGSDGPQILKLSRSAHPVRIEMSAQENNPPGNPLARHGHISYIEIPATDPEKSAAFYQAVFNWQIRGIESGRPSFDDGTGQLIGRFVTSHAIATTPGIMLYLYVQGIDAAITKITAHGGTIVKPPYPRRRPLRRHSPRPRRAISSASGNSHHAD